MQPQQIYRQIHNIYVQLDDGDHRLLAALNLTLPQFNLLRYLTSEQGHRLIELHDHLLYVKSTITRIVDQLERANLVRREDDPTDRRAQRVVLTPEGVAMRDRAMALHRQSLERRMTALSDHEQHQLAALLTKLSDGLDVDLKEYSLTHNLLA